MEIKLLDKKITKDSVYQDFYDFLKLNGFEDVYFIASNIKYPQLFITKSTHHDICISWRWEDKIVTKIFVSHIRDFDKFLIFLQNFDYDKQVEMTKLGGRNEA